MKKINWKKYYIPFTYGIGTFLFISIYMEIYWLEVCFVDITKWSKVWGFLPLKIFAYYYYYNNARPFLLSFSMVGLGEHVYNKKEKRKKRKKKSKAKPFGLIIFFSIPVFESY